MSALQEIIARLDGEGPPPRTREELEWLMHLCHEADRLRYERRRDVFARCQICQRSYGPVLPCYSPHITFPFVTIGGYGCSQCRMRSIVPAPKRWAKWDPNALLGDRGRRGPVARGSLTCHHRCRTRTGEVTTYLISRRGGILALRAALEADRDELVLGVDLAR
jgi:hypothetical protein